MGYNLLSTLLLATCLVIRRVLIVRADAPRLRLRDLPTGPTGILSRRSPGTGWNRALDSHSVFLLGTFAWPARPPKLLFLQRAVPVAAQSSGLDLADLLLSYFSESEAFALLRSSCHLSLPRYFASLVSRDDESTRRGRTTIHLIVLGSIPRQYNTVDVEPSSSGDYGALRYSAKLLNGRTVSREQGDFLVSRQIRRVTSRVRLRGFLGGEEGCLVSSDSDYIAGLQNTYLFLALA
ncbi:hypothetical protein BDZ89DRAFT_736873 [Hymenopellis radicata]|nr:hypothetical protein BDZ89DRAFT_736873 [Hymenopellis radicata]